MTFENGDVYSGNWFKGKLHGSGSAKMIAEEKQYEGEFQNGKQHGFGKFKWFDGEFYEGQWRNGLFHGEGYYGTPDGVSIRYTFSNGLPDIGSTCQVVMYLTAIVCKCMRALAKRRCARNYYGKLLIDFETMHDDFARLLIRVVTKKKVLLILCASGQVFQKMANKRSLFTIDVAFD